MKYLSILVCILFLSACATTVIEFRARPLAYDELRSFIIGTSSENDIVSVLGKPTGRTQEKDYFTLNYDDSKTGSQRLSLNFLSENSKLSGFLWVPQENEKEYFLEQAKTAFKNANFREVRDSDKNPHANSLDVVLYVDEKVGVTIRYDRSQNLVQAIARYDIRLINSRVPAGSDKRIKLPYTFGDESVVSK